MDNKLSRRIEKIKKKIESVNSECLQFPDGEGDFIEMPANISLAEIAAECRAETGKEPNKTERFGCRVMTEKQR